MSYYPGHVDDVNADHQYDTETSQWGIITLFKDDTMDFTKASQWKNERGRNSRAALDESLSIIFFNENGHVKVGDVVQFAPKRIGEENGKILYIATNLSKSGHAQNSGEGHPSYRDLKLAIKQKTKL
jgi:hypothetical protein